MKNSKLLAKSITLGLILAMPYSVANAESYIATENENINWNISVVGKYLSYAIRVQGDKTIDSPKYNIQAISGGGGYAAGIYADYGKLKANELYIESSGSGIQNNGIITMFNEAIDIEFAGGTIKTSGARQSNYGIRAQGGTVKSTGHLTINVDATIEDGDVQVMDSRHCFGIIAGSPAKYANAEVYITSADISVKGGDKNFAAGIGAEGGGYFKASGLVNVNFETENAGNAGIRAYGGTIELLNDTTVTTSNNAVAFYAEYLDPGNMHYYEDFHTECNEQAGKITVNGDAAVNSKTAALAKGKDSEGNSSIVDFKNGLTIVDGVISSISAIEGGTVKVNSSGNGNVKYTGTTDIDNNSAVEMNLTKSGSYWNLTGDSSLTLLKNSTAVDMTYDGNAFSNLNVVNLTDSDNGVFKMDIDAATNIDNSDRIYIDGTHTGTHYITLNNIGVSTVGAAGTVLVSVNDEQGSFKANDSEGALYWNRYNLDSRQSTSKAYGTEWYLKEVEQLDMPTTSVEAILGANALNYHTWRAENDQLLRRMGELRNNGADEQGAWFRVHGSKISRDDNAAFENKYTTYELGYDQVTKQTDDLTRYTGAALSYTDGSGSYNRGNGENHSKAISFYNTDIYKSGHYLDLVFKFANMDNDFNVYDTNNQAISGEYKNNGISLSAEYGRKNDLNAGWYIEPQAQLTLGYFGGDEYETSNGIKVDQGGIASVLGRIGFNIGKELGDNGIIYAKANLLHEFAGDYDVRMTDSTGISRSESNSFNDTWFEYGVGAALKTGKNNHLYFDFVKTAGGDFEKDWQWNAGMRWTF